MRIKTLSSITLAALILIISAMLTSCGEYSYNLKNYVEPGKYEGLEIASLEIDKQLDETIKMFLESNAIETEVTNRAIKKDDEVNIDYSGKVNGTVFEGGTAEDQDLVIGSGKFIEGFEDALIGKKTGDEAAIKLKFPNDYGNADLAGKDVVFDVKINKITEKTIPELTADLVAEKTSYSSVEEYKTEKRLIIKQNMLWNMIISSSNVKQYPKKEVKKYYDQLMQTYNAYASSYKMDIESYIQYFYGTDTDTFAKNLVAQAKSYALNDMLSIVISDEKDIVLTNQEYDRLATIFANESGYKDVKTLEEATKKSAVKKNALTQLVIEWVADNSIETTSDNNK